MAEWRRHSIIIVEATATECVLCVSGCARQKINKCHLAGKAAAMKLKPSSCSKLGFTCTVPPCRFSRSWICLHKRSFRLAKTKSMYDMISVKELSQTMLNLSTQIKTLCRRNVNKFTSIWTQYNLSLHLHSPREGKQGNWCLTSSQTTIII